MTQNYDKKVTLYGVDLFLTFGDDFTVTVDFDKSNMDAEEIQFITEEIDVRRDEWIVQNEKDTAQSWAEAYFG